MSIDVIFYTPCHLSKFDERFERCNQLILQRWPEGFSITDPQEVTKLHQEILQEEGFNFKSKSRFRVQLESKEQASSILEMVREIKDIFNGVEVLALHMNEVEIS